MFVLKIGQLEDENKMLRDRLKELEGTALTAINEKKTLSNELIKQKENAEAAAGKKEIVIVDKVDTKEIEEMSEAFKAVKKVLGQFMLPITSTFDLCRKYKLQNKPDKLSENDRGLARGGGG